MYKFIKKHATIPFDLISTLEDEIAEGSSEVEIVEESSDDGQAEDEVTEETPHLSGHFST
jgi:hypothetical protein